MIIETAKRGFRRAILPAAVFALAFALHFVWLGLFPENDAVRSQWALPEDIPRPGWLELYLAGESYFLGFSYSFPLAFAAWALRRYREERLCGSKTLAFGGVTLSGFLAIAGCYLVGCCGSPMLLVYANLFGASFLPWAKPLLALLTLISVSAAWLWLARRSSRKACCDPSSAGPK